jgi:hypothetical protein
MTDFFGAAFAARRTECDGTSAVIGRGAAEAITVLYILFAANIVGNGFTDDLWLAIRTRNCFVLGSSFYER